MSTCGDWKALGFAEFITRPFRFNE